MGIAVVVGGNSRLDRLRRDRLAGKRSRSCGLGDGCVHDLRSGDGYGRHVRTTLDHIALIELLSATSAHILVPLLSHCRVQERVFGSLDVDMYA